MVAGNGLLRVSGFVIDCIVGDKNLFFLKAFSLLICLNFCVCIHLMVRNRGTNHKSRLSGVI